MKLEGDAKLLRIFIGEADKWHGRPLHEALMEQARGWRGSVCSRASKATAPTPVSLAPRFSSSPKTCRFWWRS
jgi:hypothetical protein